MRRTPSLRELRCDRPANVVILPTAPARQVWQQHGPAHGKAKRELLASQAVAFPYELPFWREAAREASKPELRADVPPFDPGNPVHLRAWELIWDAAQRPGRSGKE